MADLDALVASPWWRWMPGMHWRRDFAGGQSLGDRGGMILNDWDAIDDGGRIFRIGALLGMVPDPTDPATVGCLLALMYEAEPQHVTPSPVSVCLSQFGPTDPRTVDAIIAAILAAPPPGVGHG